MAERLHRHAHGPDQLAGINAKDLVALNALLARNNLKPVAAATSAIPMPVCTAVVSAAAGRGGKKPGE